MSVPATPALCRQIAFFALGPLLCFSLKDLPPLEGMNPDGMVCLAGCAWLMLWWMTEVLPLPVTSLMAVPIFGFLGVMAPDKVFATIGHPAMMLIFGATIIVGVWKESNLIERYAYWCFNLPFVRGNPVRMVLIFTFGAGVMSAIAPNIPLTILFISIAVAIGKSCNLAPDNNMMRSLCTLSAIAPALGGVGTPLGGAPNIVVIAIVATVLGHDITFWEWSALGMPLVFVTLFACFAITALLFPVGKAGKGFSMPEGYLKKKIEALGPVSAHEHAAIWIMVVALALWCSGPQIFSALGLEEEARMMTAPVIAVLMGASRLPRAHPPGPRIRQAHLRHELGSGRPQHRVGHHRAADRGHRLWAGAPQGRRGQVDGPSASRCFWATSTACWSGSHWSSSPGSSHRSS